MKIKRISLISSIVLLSLGYSTNFNESYATKNISPRSQEISILDTTVYNHDNSIANVHIKAIKPGTNVRSISLNGKTTLGSSADFEITEPGEYQIIVEDETGFQTSKTINVDKVGRPFSSGLKNTEYKLSNDSQWLPYKDIIKISKDGLTNVIARTVDNVGNYSDEVNTVVRIDRREPLILNNVQYNEDNSSAEVTIQGLDYESGVKSLTIDGVTYNKDVVNLTITENKEIEVIAEDNSGLISREIIPINRIGIPVDSGLKNIEYRLEGAQNRDWSLYNDMFSLSSSGVTKVIARALDNAGNYSEEIQETIKIDKENPTISSTVSYDEDKLFATVNISVLDIHSGVSYIISNGEDKITSDTHSFRVDKNGTYLITAVDKAGNVSINSVEVTELKGESNNNVSGIREIQYKLEGATTQDWTTYNGEFRILNEGVTTITAKSIDNAGNISTEVSSIVKIDKSEPDILSNITYNRDNTKAVVEVNVIDNLSGVKYISSSQNDEISSNRHNFEVTENGNYLISAVDNVGNVAFKSIDITDIENSKDNENIGVKEIKYKLEGSTEQDWTTYNGQFRILNEGITVVKAKAYDKAGNISDEISIVVKIDKTVPDILEEVVYNKDFTSATISVTSSDSLSGVKHIISENNENINSNKYEFTVRDNGNYLISSVDIAGNIAFKGISVDSIINSDSPSEIDRIEYKLEGAVTQDWTSYTKPFIITKEGTTTVKAKIYDIAGNVSDESTIIVNIDKTSPLISNSISYNVDNTEASVTVVASDKLSGVKHITSSNNDIVTANTHTFKVSDNGNYLVSATDIAGNVSFESISVSGINGKDNPSDIDRIEYKLEGATKKDWTTYTDVFKVINEGTTIVTGRSIDRAGNISDELKLEVKIDKTKPSNNQITIRPL